MPILGASDRIVIGIGTRQKGKRKDGGMGCGDGFGCAIDEGRDDVEAEVRRAI